jgi:NADH dehydrogenase
MSARAVDALRRLGVIPMLNATAVEVSDRSISIAVESGDLTEVQARTIISAAGVAASPLARALAEASGAELDRAGRTTVQPDLTLPGFPEVFAVGTWSACPTAPVRPSTYRAWHRRRCKKAATPRG